MIRIGTISLVILVTLLELVTNYRIQLLGKGVQTQFTEDHVPLIINNKTDYVTYNKTSEIIGNSTRSSPLETSEGVVDIPSNSSRFYETNSKYILSIAIAPLYSNITLKMKSQQLVIFNLMRLSEHIRLLVFTSDPYWIQFCRQHQINYTTDIRYNYARTPFMNHMLRKLLRYRSDYYAYMNGDLLLSKNIIDVLFYVNKQRLSGQLKSDVFLTGRRYNWKEELYQDLLQSSYEEWTPSLVDSLIESATFKQAPFNPLALDYFIFTRHIIRTVQFSPLAIGRNFVDAVLMDTMTRLETVDTIDVTDAIQVVHLNHDMFNDVFKKSQIDNAYNKQQYKNPLVSKSIRSCSIHLYRIGDDYEFVYQKKEDDRYTNEEMKHIVPYIQKTDNVLMYNYNTINGTLSSYSHSLVSVYFDIWGFHSSHLAENTHPVGVYMLPTVPKNDTCFQYANYVRGPYNGYGFRFRKPSQYDVILADPICPHHILQYGAPRTPQNTTFIVRGLNLYINRGLLEIIKEGFTVIDEYVPPKDSHESCLSIHVFKKKEKGIYSMTPFPPM